MIHYSIIVRGRVQGVWFRKYTQESALNYGLTGFVKNAADGSVFIEAEGEAKKLDLFVVWLNHGSPLSEVSGVDVKTASLKGYVSFDISR